MQRQEASGSQGGSAAEEDGSQVEVEASGEADGSGEEVEESADEVEGSQEEDAEEEEDNEEDGDEEGEEDGDEQEPEGSSDEARASASVFSCLRLLDQVAGDVQRAVQTRLTGVLHCAGSCRGRVLHIKRTACLVICRQGPC